MKKISPLKFIYYLPLGLIYISLPIFMIIDFATNTFSIWIEGKFFPGIIPIIIIFSLWINDTMAYIVGSLMGRTPLSKISPKKTWEGTIGGVVLTILIAILVCKLYGLCGLVIFAAISSVFGTLGDLLESKIKRLAGVKDSGSLLPGHGGFLDRFDSLLVATPFVWLYVYFFMR